MENVLVIDRGKKYYKFSVFKVAGKKDGKVDNPNHLFDMSCALVQTKILENENFSDNLFSLELERFVNSLEEDIDRLLFLLDKNAVGEHKFLQVENSSKKENVKREIKKQIREQKSGGDYTTDWEIQDYNTEENHVQVLTTSVSAGEILKFAKVAKNLNIKHFSVLDNVYCLKSLVSSMGTYGIVDIGQSGSSYIIVHNGKIVAQDRNKNGADTIDEDLRKNKEIKKKDFYDYKHNSRVADLQALDCTSFLSIWNKSITDFIINKGASLGLTVKDVSFIGGSSLLDLENYITDGGIRFMPPDALNRIKNLRNIPEQYLPFLYNSIAAVLYLYTNDNPVDLAAAKEGGFNVLIKNVLEYEKPLTWGLTAVTLTLAVLVTGMYTYDYILKKEQKAMVLKYSNVNQNAVNTLQTNVNKTKDETDKLIKQLTARQGQSLKISKLTSKLTEIKPVSVSVNRMYYKNSSLVLNVFATDIEDVRNFSKLIKAYLFKDITLYDAGIDSVNGKSVYKFNIVATGYRE